MPGPQSKQSKGPGNNTPLVPTWMDGDDTLGTDMPDDMGTGRSDFDIFGCAGRMDRRDVQIRFSQGMPHGYEVWWIMGHEMYFWRRLSDDHIDGPYCDRFVARRGAIKDSKRT